MGVKQCSGRRRSPGLNAVIHAALNAAVIPCTRRLAAELRTEGARVNAARFEATRVLDQRTMDSSVKSLVRYGEPEEASNAAVFLVGPRSRRMTGQILRVGGGGTLFPG